MLLVSVGLDCTVKTAVRFALPGFGAKVTDAVPVVLDDAVFCNVTHDAVVVIVEGQSFEPPVSLRHEIVVDPPPAGKLVPFVELIVKKLLVHGPWACSEPAPATPTATTVNRNARSL
jgi:hypothetical protein